MLGNAFYIPVVVSLDYDPAADDDIAIWRAPFACEIRSAYATPSNAVNGSTANYFDLALYNGGTSGTALTAISGTIGGTAAWAALTPTAFTISAGALTAGQLVKLRYNEEGTGTFTQMIVQLDVQPGT
jgi:hypothetical protein